MADPAPKAPTPLPNTASSSPTPPRAGGRPQGNRDIEQGLRRLPSYSRSLLKIRVPLVVRLAATKLPLSRIIELSPGSIIQFDKSCEETLTLEVGNHDVAAGEAVKVGDKFGLRITSMVMPGERFIAVRGTRGGKQE